ncbi:hypothetical protein [Vibrio sp. D431a]|uniref:hypothetical protein n=1 Tax=Vibrio sp. D431a TaxID=2837388 RepID=UPI0025530A33|nr:hypothetical protein [Vibrio sp. D431a]MDK9793780.1 hypothetical protein [Vibrio sp. D431a]
MSLNINAIQETVKAALEQLTFNEHQSQKLQVADGIIANVEVYNRSVNIQMLVDGWWSKNLATAKISFNIDYTTGDATIAKTEFSTSGGGLDDDANKTLETYCEAMERRGVAHIAVAMIAKMLNTEEYAQKAAAQIKADFHADQELQEKKNKALQNKLKEDDAAHDAWKLENSAILTEADAKAKIKEITKANADKKDAERYVTNQTIEVTKFNKHNREEVKTKFRVSHNSGHNTWEMIESNEYRERVSAKYVTRQLKDGFVTLVD